MVKLPSIVVALTVVLITFPSTGFGDAPAPIAPDRPGFTNGSEVVPGGWTEIETGATITTINSKNGGGETTDAPEALIRVGVTPTLEGRITVPDYFSANNGGPRGYGDGALGVKWKYYQSRSGSTKLALTPAISLPSHDANYSSGTVDPSLVFGGQTTSGSRWGIAANAAVTDATVNNSRVVAVAPSSSVNYQLTGVLTAYGEIYDNFPRTGRTTPITDGGLILVPNNNVQYDIEAGYGLGGGAPIRFLAGGMSIRFK